MYKIAALLIAATFTFNIPSWSQKKLSLSVLTGSGISFFGGSGDADKSTYYRNGLSFPNAVDTMANPYGRKPFTNFLAGLQAGITLPSKWILLLSAQYEHTGGRLTSDSVISPSASIKTTGKYSRYYDFISVNPQIGRILFQKGVTLTLHTGIDYTSKLDMGNTFEYRDQNGLDSSIGYSGGEPEVNDLRVSFGVSVTRKKWSLDINYKHGLVDYMKYSADKVYARILHIRLQYAFLSKNI
jgi:hypothetical protein